MFKIRIPILSEEFLAALQKQNFKLITNACNSQLEKFMGANMSTLKISYLGGRGTTITAASNSVTHQRLQRTIQNKRRGMLLSGIVLHDNVRLHTAAATKTICSVFDGKCLITNHKAWTWHPLTFIPLFTWNAAYENSILAQTMSCRPVYWKVSRYDKCLSERGDKRVK